MSQFMRWTACCFLMVALACVAAQPNLDRVPSKSGWTSAQAMQMLARQPNDAYLQYVAIQLALRDGTSEQQRWQLDSLIGRGRFDPGRRERVDLFSTFTGALAVQESLQLDTMMGDQDDMPRGRRRPDAMAKPAEITLETTKADDNPATPLPPKPAPPMNDDQPRVVETLVKSKPRLRDIAKALRPPKQISIDSLGGPTIKSHPWAEMLAGKKPDVGALAKCVPEDFYFVEFKSTNALVQALSIADMWGDHLFTQMMGQANSADTEKRIKKQLGIAGIPPAVIDAMGVESVAVTGSDLYLADGSDVTLLVQGKQVVAMRQWADGMLQKANAKNDPGEYLGIKYERRTSDDGDVNVYTADPKPDLHVRSNSLPAFQRVLAAINGKDDTGKPVARLGDSTEFAYIRTILPRGAGEEDGIIYLSDPCIRRLVGPRVKLGQRRRLIAFNHLKMIEHAATMFRTENGRAPKSFAELADSGCAPGKFGEGKLACPTGGKYTLSADGMSGVNSIFGKPGHLTPLIAVPIASVSELEGQIYKEFLDDYNQYWRTFFDPIAVRVKVTPEQYRLETVILPLIDNSIYTGMATALGPHPASLDPAAASKKTIMSVAAKLNKKALLDLLPPDPSEAEAKTEVKPQNIGQAVQNLRMLMIAMHTYASEFGKFPPAGVRSNNPGAAKDGKPLLSWRVALLPYLENANLYQQFKHDEPWDSPHNKKLIEKMPAIYAGRNPKTTAQFKTPFVVPVAKETMFSPDGRQLDFGKIVDGMSNTICIAEVDDDKAVIWTKPDDMEVDLNAPLKNLIGDGREGFLVGMGDGAVYQFRRTIPADIVKAMMTIAGGEVIDAWDNHTIVLPFQRGRDADIFGLSQLIIVPKVRQFLRDGIGDQIAMHVHDASQPISVQVTGAFGGTGLFQGFGMRVGGMESFGIAFFAQALTNPMCVTVPVRDAKIVDEFLKELDSIYADKIANQVDRFLRPEFYTITMHGQPIRCIAIKFAGLNVRFCWGRIGNQLCIVNHPAVFDDIQESIPGKDGVTGHAMLRVRPENWNAVLPIYQLGWEEGQRSACQGNTSRLSNVALAWPELSRPGEVTPELTAKFTQLYSGRPFCPDGGKWTMNDHRDCTCSIHGGWNNPRQALAPAKDSATAKSVAGFGGLTATLTFLDDGLHAIVTINRK